MDTWWEWKEGSSGSNFLNMKIRFFAVVLFLTFLYGHGQTSDCPCCAENHTDFDFWVGSWVVENSEGKKLGNNTIKKLEEGCVLQEQWVSADGNSTGTSLNFFNQSSGQWEQLWVDNSGTYLKLKGNREGEQMILASEPFIHTDGGTYINRITWTNNKDGTVRQVWEVLSSDKNLVSVLFDGIYRKLD